MSKIGVNRWTDGHTPHHAISSRGLCPGELKRDRIKYFQTELKLKSVPSHAAHQAGAYPGFCGVKRLRVQDSPLNGTPVRRKVNPQLLLVLIFSSVDWSNVK